MARPENPELKSKLLGKIIRYVEKNGVAEFSLRALAAEIGTSHRTILYHFTSREALLCTIFDTKREEGKKLLDASLPNTGDPKSIFKAIWRYVAQPEMRETLRSFYEMYGIATRDPARFGDYAQRTAHYWHEAVTDSFRNAGYPSDKAHIFGGMTIAVLRGATLELAASNETERLTSAVDAFLDMLPTSADAQ